MIKFPRIELYLPLSNDAILCQWHYYVPNFKFLASPSTITTSPPINWNLGNANHFKLLQPSPPPPQLVISTRNANLLSYLSPPAIRILSIHFPDLSPNSEDIK